MREENGPSSEDYKKVIEAFEELSKLQAQLLSQIKANEEESFEQMYELEEFKTKRHTFVYVRRTGALFITEDYGTDDETTVLVKKHELSKFIEALKAALTLNNEKHDG